MNLLDMRSIVFNHVVTDVICVWLVVLLWRQNRGRFAGTAFWVFDFAFQTAALILIALRGVIPDFLSMVLSNTLVVAGAILGFMGLERFVGKKGSQIHNYLLVTLFVFIHGYFTFIQPSLAVRNLNITVATLLVCLQSVWLMWRRVEPGLRSLTFGVGLVNFFYCLVGVVRIVKFLAVAHTEDNYLQAGLFEVLVLLSYQMLFILLTYSLVLMVNKRLLMEVSTQEEKFAKAFHSAPYAIMLSRLSDGTIVDANETFSAITGYDRAEVVGKKATDVGPWEHREGYAAVVDALAKSGKVRGMELPFRKKDGERVTGLLSAEIVAMGGEEIILSSIADITQRKQAEEEIRLNESRMKRLVDILQRPSETIQEFLDYALEQAIQLTESKLGYIYHYHEDRREFVLNTWSKDVMAECAIADAPTCYALDKTGIWGEAVRQRRPIVVNDFQAAHPLKKGCPEGHARLLKFMTLPILQGNSIVGVVGLANKETDYNETNILQVSLLMEAVWKVIERKQAEDALRKNRTQMADIIEFLPDATLAIDKEKHVIIWNRAIEEMTGVPATEMIGKGGYAYTIPFYGEARPQLMDLVSADYGEISTRYPGITRSGETLMAEVFCKALYNNRGAWVFAKASPLHDQSGNVIGAIESIRDITDRKWAEAALRESEAALSRAQEIAHLGSWEHDTKTGKLIWSDEAYRIFGFTPREVEVTSDLLLGMVHPEDRNKIEKAVSDVRDGFGQYDVEYRIIRRDGREGYVHSRRHLLSAKEEPGKIFGMIQDITDRKRAEADKEKLEAQNRQLQKAESLSRVAGAIAHHFNNQLTVVIGNLELAIDGLPRGKDAAGMLTAAMHAAGKAAEMSGMMLTYLGQMLGKREPLDLSEACRRELPILRSAMPGKIVLETYLPSPGPVISANVNQIRQVLTNLITNAWEAVGEGRGSVHLRVKTVSATEIPAVHHDHLDWQPQDTFYACLEVTDTGSGIANENIGNIFDPFFSTKFIGRGMGLSVVMGIVRAHDGVISVASEPGRGSAFCVFFPVSAGGVLPGKVLPQAPDKALRTPEMEGSGAVLLVDDEERVRHVGAAMLTCLGFAVLEAKDGIDALEVFRQHRGEIRCVLCDLTMPRMDGWETLAVLRKLAPGIPVILASGYDEDQVMAGSHSELPQVFLGKPYKLKGLGDAIDQALGRKKQG